MIYKEIDLYAYFSIERRGAKGGILRTYARSASHEMHPKARPAMLVIPGGGYAFVSEREAEPVALKFVMEGYAAFVLTYSTRMAYPTPLLEACMAVIYMRENASQFCVDREKIAAVGFSAGGHLAAMLATICDEKEIAAILGGKVELARLNAVILSYPVITTGEYTHRETRDTITAGDPDLSERLSMEKRVTKTSAPAFIWHTVEDGCVPVENSLLLAGAYRAAGVPFSLHLFEKGWHGMSVCNIETQSQENAHLEHVGKWFDLAIDWLTSRGFSVKIV